jgi:hypothetical protein
MGELTGTPGPTVNLPVVDVVVFSDNTQGLVGVVLVLEPTLKLALPERKTPVFHVDMLMPFFLRGKKASLMNRDSRSIEIRSSLCADQTEKGGSQISVGGDELSLGTFCDTRATDDERDVDVFLEATFLSWLETVLANVISVVYNRLAENNLLGRVGGPVE